jgi:hypothetical protein
MSPDSSFFAPPYNALTAATLLERVANESSALASSKVNSSRQPLSYAGQCAALALYRQTVARYLADVDAVEGDPCFFDAIGRLHKERYGR